VWFDAPPSAADVAEQLGWPVFVKGNRQTSKHKAELAVARTTEDFARIAEHYARDPILHLQPMVCRSFVPLRPVHAPPSDTIPPSFEFRTFWYHGVCIGASPYWASTREYTWTGAEEQAALAAAQHTAQRIDVPFLVVDVAQTTASDWIVIECNDGQESGYVGVSPFALWQRVVEEARRVSAQGG
jgi:hypothetical protein